MSLGVVINPKSTKLISCIESFITSYFLLDRYKAHWIPNSFGDLDNSVKGKVLPLFILDKKKYYSPSIFPYHNNHKKKKN